MTRRRDSSTRWLFGLLLVPVLLALAAVIHTRPVAGHESETDWIARGGGTTLIHGGTGPSAFTPVQTTLSFYAQRSGSSVTGSFDCLAVAPETGGGSQSAQFTVNVMYVVGTVEGATVNGDAATLTGHATITGLGVGTNVPFTFVVRRGGPGTTAELTVNTLPGLPFHEVLLNGNFEIFHGG
jgi:hypothetical protein